MSTRKPRRITVQLLKLPYLPDQIRIARHYGRGVPIAYNCVIRRPDGVAIDQWAEYVAARVARIEGRTVTILPASIGR